jgi:hypothetical protein
MAALSTLRNGYVLLPRNIIFLLVVLIYVRACETQGLVRPEGLRKLKKIIHLIGSQTLTFRTVS